MGIILTIGYILIFIRIIYKWKYFRIYGLSQRAILILFLLKVFVGFALALVYTHYYTDRSTADIYRYFDDSKIMFDTFHTNPGHFFQMLFGINDNSKEIVPYYMQMNNWYRQYESVIYNDNHIIIRINAVMRFFSFGYYGVHNVFMNFISLIGLISIYKAFVKKLRDKEKMLVFAVFLLPSVIFWGSGVLKEGLLFFFIGIFIYNFFRIAEIFSAKPAILVFISLFFLLFLKIYILAAILPGAIAYYWVSRSGDRKIFLKYLMTIMLFITFLVSIKFVFPQLDFARILATKQENFINLSKHMHSGSIIQVGILQPDILSIIKNSPHAFFNTLLMPDIFQINSIFTLLAAFENLFVIILILVSLIYFQKNNLNLNLLIFLLLFVTILFVLIGLVTPVAGAIVRYKTPALPFLLIAIIMITDKSKIISKINYN
ncbi:MAG: hypothetical protein PHD97_01330 [Bacteroidales bacterium]|nr:hypothetical protein [Bacteroidales bacterium]